MQSKMLLASAAAAAVLAPGFHSLAQTADGGPVRFVAMADDRVLMVSGDRPLATPTSPVEVWAWTFYKTPQGQGDTAVDTLAARYRIDCSTSTVAPLFGEAYREGRMVTSHPSSIAPYVPGEGSIVAFLVRSVCEPGFNSRAGTFTDPAAGRIAALGALARAG